MSEDRQSLSVHRTQDNRKARDICSVHTLHWQSANATYSECRFEATHGPMMSREPSCDSALSCTHARTHINKIATASGNVPSATLPQNANIWLLASNLYRPRASSKTEWDAATPFTSRYKITFHPRPVRMELCLRHWPYSGDVNAVSKFIYRVLQFCGSVLWEVTGVGAIWTMLLHSKETTQWGKWLLVLFVTSYAVHQIKQDEIDGSRDAIKSLWTSGYYIYHQILHSATLRSAHTVYLCVWCGSQSKQRLFPYTLLTDWFL